MNYAQLITDSNLAFSIGNYEISLGKANEAIRLAPNESKGYYCAGKAYMSMDKASNAVDCFKKAIAIDKTNGTGFFLLGYAQALNGESAKALQSLTKAVECKCEGAILGRFIKPNFSIGRNRIDSGMDLAYNKSTSASSP